MNGVRRSVSMMAMAAALLAVPAAVGAATIVLPRPGQVGLGVQGGYGTLFKTGDVGPPDNRRPSLGGTFGDGVTIAFRLRYRMRYERAIGLTFENQRHTIRVAEPLVPGPTPGTFLPGRERINMVLSGVEFYRMFGTRTRTNRMLMVGAGVAQTSGRFLNNETFYPGDGGFVSAGFGVERFLMKSWALDFSTRYMMVFIPDERVHDVQVALGLIFYASY